MGGWGRLEPAEGLGFAVGSLPSFGGEGRLEGADARCVQEFGGFQHAALGDPLEGQGKRRSGPSYAKRVVKNFNVDVAHGTSDPSDATGHEFGSDQFICADKRQKIKRVLLVPNVTVQEGLSSQMVLTYDIDGTLWGFDTTTSLGYKALWLNYEDPTSKGDAGVDAWLHGPIMEIALRW